MKRIIGISSIVLSLVVVTVLTLSQEEPAKKAQEKTLMKVYVQEAERTEVQDIVTGYGQVSARWKTTLASVVGGRVTYVADNLLRGASFNKGDVLAVIEDTEYQAAAARAKSALATAQRTLAEERQRSVIAKQNWKNSGFKGEPSALVVRTPQLDEIKAQVAAAQADVEKAEYDLAQTRILAPYNGVVLNRSINPGDVLQLGQSVAEIYDSTVFDITIPLNENEMQRLSKRVLDTPVTLALKGKDTKATGTVTRVDKMIDGQNRWQNVIVELQNTDKFLPGAFVTAELKGRMHDKILVLPESLVDDSAMVWYVDDLDLLQKFKANILFQKAGFVYLAPPPDLHTAVRFTAARDIYLAGVKVLPVMKKKTHDMEDTIEEEVIQ